MSSDNDVEPAYTVREVAKMLKLHPDTVRVMIRNKKIPAVKVGGTYRVRKSVVEHLLGIEQKPNQ